MDDDEHIRQIRGGITAGKRIRRGRPPCLPF